MRIRIAGKMAKKIAISTLSERGDNVKHGELNVECADYQQWKSVLKEELASATTFEIHCWNEETEWIELALQYGNPNELAWDYGMVISGVVSPKFVKWILDLPKPNDADLYNKMTPFFSIFLNNGFCSEHYGTELSKI